MSDPALSSLFPTHQIGADGFNWWIGQVEAKDTDPPYSLTEKSSNRYKVRIVGKHLKDGSAIPTAELPWSFSALPITTPYSDGGVTGAVPKLTSGSWVVGFFMEPPDKKPMIIASIGHTAGSTVEREEDPNPTGSEKSFVTHTSSKTDPYTDLPDNYESTGPTKVGERGAVADSSAASITAQIKSFYGDNTGTNPGGYNFCVSIADPNCGAENDLKGELTRILGEMLAANQNSGGQIGDFLVGKAMGELTDITDNARKYVNKILRVITSLWSRVKGEIVKQIRLGVDELTKALLRPDESGNALTPVTEFFNNLLKDLGCQMEDLGKRLEKWLTDLLFGYLYDIYQSAACQVDILVNGIVSEIQNLLNELIEDILGPIQELLGGVASVLNIIGNAINEIFTLLGISCDGPGAKCQKKKTACTDCATEEKKKDFLDELLAELESGPQAGSYTCTDAIKGVAAKDTTVTFVGGSFQENDKIITYEINSIKVTEGNIAIFSVKRYGYTGIASSVKYKTKDGTALEDLDYQKVDKGILGFSPGETEKQIEIQTFADEKLEGEEDFFVILAPNSPSEDVATQFEENVGQCFIVETAINPNKPLDDDDLDDLEVPENLETPTSVPTTKNPALVLDTVNDGLDEPTTKTIDGLPTDLLVTDSTALEKQYSVKAYINGDTSSSSKIAKEGDFVLYVINTENVEEGTVLGWSLFGPGITPSDILGGKLNGTVVVNNAKAYVSVGIEEDTNIENDETLIFQLNGTSAFASIIIQGDVIDDESLVVDELQPYTPPSPPSVSDPITDDNGSIITIPISQPGSPYVEPPTVLITGNGYGAKGLALLDSKGFVTEVRLLNKGVGYKSNTPTDNGLQCIIDSFTMVRPGRGYSSAPKVYVNGELGVAEAIVNEDGFISSVRILDRYKKYTNLPAVTILGGGGFGAKFVPSLVCLDQPKIEAAGVAKIGTGRYIDCP